MATAGASDKGATAVHTGGSARSDKDSSPSPAEQLSDTVIALVLACLVGDVASLCAAACVARAWRDAAATPSLWVRIDGPGIQIDGNHATAIYRCLARLTDARFQSLAARALGAGGTTSLHLYETPVTDEGCIQALSQQQQPVLHLIAGGNNCKLTGKGIAIALKRFGGKRANIDGDRSCNAGSTRARGYCAPAWGTVPRCSTQRATRRAFCATRVDGAGLLDRCDRPVYRCCGACWEPSDTIHLRHSVRARTRLQRLPQSSVLPGESPAFM